MRRINRILGYALWRVAKSCWYSEVGVANTGLTGTYLIKRIGSSDLREAVISDSHSAITNHLNLDKSRSGGTRTLIKLLFVHFLAMIICCGY